MKFTLSAIILALSMPFSQAQGINFKDLTFSEALAAAKAENKPIFMDAYTTWCGPCKWMSANIFTLEEVGDYYNENYICVKFDMEKGEGIELAKQFSVKAYPTLLYINSNEELLHVQIGASRQAEDYITWGEKAKDPKANMVFLAANKEENKTDEEFMKAYLSSFGSAGRLEEGELEAFYMQLPFEKWLEDEHFYIITGNVKSVSSPIYQKLAKKQSEAKELREDGYLDQFLESILYRTLASESMMYQSKKENFTDRKEELLEMAPIANKEKVLFDFELFIAQRQGDWDTYCETCLVKLKKYYWDDANKLNQIAWNVFENSEESQNLEQALVWAERAVELEPKSHAILDTYANLLLVNEQPEKALEVENKAVELAKADGADVSSYNEVIEKIEARLGM